MNLTSPRKIGLATAVAVVVANMVGTGIFTSLGYQVAGLGIGEGELVPGFSIILLWVLGGLISFSGAVCYGELGAMFPRSGGEYHLLRSTWHPLVGFVSGWLSLTVGFAAPVAAAASAFASYAGQAAAHAEIASWLAKLVGVAVVLLITIIHLGRIHWTGRFQVTMTVLKLVLIVVLIVAAFAADSNLPVTFLPVEGDGARIFSTSFAESLFWVMYAYTGWNAAAYIVDEIDRPTRNLPLAMLIGTGLVMALYVAVNAAFLSVTPVDEMAGKKEVGFFAGRALFGEAGGRLIAALIAFGLLSTISAMTWAGPRVTQTIGQDYHLFAFFSRRNRFGVPVWAILLQALLVIALLLTARFDQIVRYVQALLTLSSILVVVAVVYLRWKRPDVPRPYRAWGYPVTPLVFCATGILMLYGQFREHPGESLWGLTTVVAGALLYLLAVRIRERGTG